MGVAAPAAAFTLCVWLRTNDDAAGVLSYSGDDSARDLAVYSAKNVTASTNLYVHRGGVGVTPRAEHSRRTYAGCLAVIAVRVLVPLG